MTVKEAHDQMHEFLLDRALAWEYRMDKAGLLFVYTSVGRSDRIQMALYAQGRNELPITNQYRSLAGMPLIDGKENKKIVTWTLNSQHITNLRDGNPENDYSRAFDYAIGTPMLLYWDIKVNINKNQMGDYEEAARLAQRVGLEPGFFWKKPDPPHVQLPYSILKELGIVS